MLLLFLRKREVGNMERKKYCTGFYSMQLLLSNVEGIEIEDIIIKEMCIRDRISCVQKKMKEKFS